MDDSLTTTLDQEKTRRGLLALVGAGGAAAVAALWSRSNGAEAAPGGNFILGQHNDAGTAGTSLEADVYGMALQVRNTRTGDFADGIVGLTDGRYGWGVEGLSTGADGTGVWGQGEGARATGVFGVGKPGVWGYCVKTNGSGVRGQGNAPGSIGLYGLNTLGRRALRTKGQVQTDCARKVTLSNKNNLVSLPTGIKAGSSAIVLATVQGAPGNEALVRRAFRVDSTHIRIQFDKKPANPTAVGYWVIHTG